MDLITHVLVSYLVTLGVVGLQPQYVAAGALAGGLPDADALLFPLARRWPIFGHRGITHSLLGVTVIAIAGALIAPLLLAGSPLLYFLVMELGGILHILMDGFTNFSVPPLLPFSSRRVAIDADRAVNFYTLIFSIVSMYILLGVERNQVVVEVYWVTVYALGAFFAVYFAVRLGLRYWLGRKVRASGGVYRNVVPTENPFVWFLFGERRENGRLTAHFGRYAVGSGFSGPYTIDVAMTADAHATAPVGSVSEALDRSFPLLAAHRGRIYDDTWMFASAEPTPDGGWKALWYSVEFGSFGRWATIEIQFPKDGGAPEVHRRFRKVTMPWKQRPTA